MNPYRPPNAATIPEASRSNPLWWIYWALSSLIALSSFAMLALSSEYFSGFKTVALASGVVDVAALAGLFFYLRLKPVFHRVFWRLVLAISVLKLIGPTIGLIRNATTFTGVEQRVALVAAVSAQWAFPLLYGLSRYAFSSRLWRRVSETPAAETSRAEIRMPEQDDAGLQIYSHEAARRIVGEEAKRGLVESERSIAYVAFVPELHDVGYCEFVREDAGWTKRVPSLTAEERQADEGIEDVRIAELAREGNLIAAIRLYRVKHGVGLKDAHDAVQRLV